MLGRVRVWIEGGACRSYLLHGRLNVAAYEGAFQIAVAGEFDVPRVGGDVAERIHRLSGEPEPDSDGVELVDRFGGMGRFLQYDLTKG